ncbi:MAG: hypothetical protein GQ564_13265 [Bacteroidales bacterium]|nr:hypothetical protein [Bacteroidales bacterium]
MINFIFRLFLTFNSTSLIIVVFMVKEQYIILSLYDRFPNIPDFISYLIYFSVPVIFTFLSLLMSKWLDSDSVEPIGKESAVLEIEQANNAFLPSYLGYFFVALSVPYFETLIFVFAILFVFTFLSQTLYFNPLFLLYRYHFYYLTTSNKTKIFLISKKKLKNPNNIKLPLLKRINNFTFIDKEN